MFSTFVTESLLNIHCTAYSPLIDEKPWSTDNGIKPGKLPDLMRGFGAAIRAFKGGRRGDDGKAKPAVTDQQLSKKK